MGRDHAFQRLRLQLPVAFGPIKRHDLRHRHPADPRDLRVQLKERHAQRLACQPTQRRLARAAQAHKAHPLRPRTLRRLRLQHGQHARLHPPVGAAEHLGHAQHLGRPRIVLAHQPLHRQVERAGHLGQKPDGDVALAGLQLREVARRDARHLRQHAARDVTGLAGAADTLAHAGQQGLHGPVRLRPARRHVLCQRPSLAHPVRTVMNYSAHTSRFARGGNAKPAPTSHTPLSPDAPPPPPGYPPAAAPCGRWAHR